MKGFTQSQFPIPNAFRALISAILAASLIACARLPTNYERHSSEVITDTASTQLAQSFKSDFAKQKDLSGFYPLIEGSDALIARISSIRAAQKSLDVQYYIWHDDLTGHILLNELMLAADRGVRVRLLLDDLNQSKLYELLAVLEAHPNIEIRMTNPLANRFFRFLDVVRFDQIQRRMHNKALVADNILGIIGGRNVGDEYFTASDDMNFSDFDVWCAGPIVSEFSKQFDLYWNNEHSIPISALHQDIDATPEKLQAARKELQEVQQNAKNGPFGFSLKESDLSKKFQAHQLVWYWAKSRAIFDSPKKLDEDKAHANKPLEQKLEPLIEGAKHELIVVSSYYIPGDDGIKEMAANVARGVKTTVLTNSLASNDVVGAFAGYMDYRKPLIQAGVELYELQPKAHMAGVRKRIGSSGARTGLHGKMYIKDRSAILIGSMNLDPRSLKYNSEMGVVIYSPVLAKMMAENLNRDLPTIAYRLTLDKDSGEIRWHTLQDGKPVVLESEPEVGFWLKLAVHVLDWILPENLL